MRMFIKKYTNRKLFSTGHSKYVSLSWVLDRILEDHDIVVVCHKTGQDLTFSVVLSVFDLAIRKKTEKNKELQSKLLPVFMEKIKETFKEGQGKDYAFSG